MTATNRHQSNSAVDVRVVDVIGYDLAPVPEPSSLAMLGAMVAGVSGYAWRRRRRKPAAAEAVA